MHYVSEEDLIDKRMKIDVNLNDAEKVPCQLGINPLYARNKQLIPYIYLFIQ